MSSSGQLVSAEHLVDREEGSVNSTEVDSDTASVGGRGDSDDKPLLFAFEEETGSDKPVDLSTRTPSRHPLIKQLLDNSIFARHTRLIVTGGILCLTLLTTFAFLTAGAGAVKQSKPGPYWLGFSNISNIFAFGDSWTTVHFDVDGDQPSPSNPFGNPEFPGWTSSNGFNYIGYLATKYNHSQLNVYDFAFSGSVIDTHYDLAMLDWLDLPHQIKDEFQLHYVRNSTEGRQEPIGWSAEDSLFTTFFGINDIMVYDRSQHYQKKLFDSYERLIGDLYQMSARNFLVINIPAVDASPAGMAYHTPQQQSQMRADIKDFNRLIKSLIKHLRTRYPSITIFEYDVHDLSTRVMANPKSVLQTVSYRNTTGYCREYEKFEKGQVANETQLRTCGLRVDEYMWLNTLHVTPPFHEAMAAKIEEILLGSV